MTEYVKCTPNQLPRLIRGRVLAFAGRCERAVERTARAAVPIIQGRTPKAFGDLVESVHAEEDRTVVNAPHAAAVERGSAPHRPNMEALIRWVKLRGMQGLTGRGKIRSRFARELGPTTAQHAMNVAGMLKALEVRGKRGTGRHLPIDAAEQVAEAIAAGIEKHGTKPTWFVRESLPQIGQVLLENLRRAKGRSGSTTTHRRVIKIFDV